MKTVGIIGGFGPESTAMFYLRLVDACRRRKHGTQPRIILRNVDVPRKLEHDALVHGKNLNAFIPFLTSTARQLERDGANVIVLPCNTLHVHAQEIRKAIGIPFISIIDATAEFLRVHTVHRVGFLGSRVTVEENLFARKTPSVSFVTVPKNVQRDIDLGLDDFVATQEGTKLATALAKAFAFLESQDIHHVLLACTDFHGLCPNIPGVKVHDTLDILVRATADML